MSDDTLTDAEAEITEIWTEIAEIIERWVADCQESERGAA